MVPTALAYHNGWYFGNLFQFPIHQGTSNVYHLDENKRIHVVVPEVTTVTAIAFDSRSRMYVLEMAAVEGGPVPGMGKVVRYEYNGQKTDIATGLSFPTGMAFGSDGVLYVSNFGFGFPAGAGQIVAVHISD
jgi:sugar lactone lactonase YvrE